MLIGAVIGIYFGKVRPESLARQAELESEIHAQAVEADRLKRESRERDAQLADLRAKPEPPRATPTASARVVEPPPVVRPPLVVIKKPCPKSLDPLNDCL